MRPHAAGPATDPLVKGMVLALALVCGSTACDAISGVDEIDFTRTSDTTGGGGAAGGGGTAGGGTGSDTSYDIPCGSGNVAVGVHGRSGAAVDRIGLICAPLAGDGSLGTAFQTETAGGDGGSPGSVICPASQVLVGIDIWVDSTVYKVDLLCQSVADWKASDASTNAVPGIGTANSTEFAVTCPKGTAIDHIGGHADQLVRSVNPSCLTL